MNYSPSLREHYSQTPRARQAREANLSNPERLEKQREYTRGYRNRKAAEKIATKRSIFHRRHDHLVRKIQFHLSRGRDEGYMAIALNVPVSEIRDVIAGLDKPQTPSHNRTP